MIFNIIISKNGKGKPTRSDIISVASEVEISKQIANQILEEISEKCIKSGIAKNCKDN